MALQCLSVLPIATLRSSPHLGSEKAGVFNRSIVLRSNNPNNGLTFRKLATRKNAYIIKNEYPTTETGERTHAEKTLTRKDFPSDFIFGAGSAAIQIEGGDGTEGGRGLSNWDAFMNKAFETSRGDGVDSYNLYKEDVRVAKKIGLDFYRFSISWARILPDGDKKNVNKEGIAYYHSLLDELEANKIKPLVTIFHFDMPDALQKKYGGFTDRRIIDSFQDYSEVLFENFGHRVKHWTTINEAIAIVMFGPNVMGPIDTSLQYIQAHNLILAHAAASNLYKTKYQAKQGGEIGMTLSGKWCEPLDPKSPADKAAADDAFERYVGWFLSPVLNGDYPQQLKDFVKNLPEFSEKEKEILRKSSDYVGMNYYTSSFATPGVEYTISSTGHERREFIAETDKRDGMYLGPVTDGLFPTYVYPEGLRKMLVYIKDNYNNPKVYITESGVPGQPKILLSVNDARAVGKHEIVDVELKDDYRIDAIYGHIQAVHEAKKEGVNVKGYFVWTLLDNNEFGNFTTRFGLTYIDYLNQSKRYPKKSAYWYRSFLNPGMIFPINTEP